MKKSQSHFSTITKILFILAVLLVLYFLYTSLFNKAKGTGIDALDNLLNKFLVTEQDYSKLNQDAKTSFNELIKDIRECNKLSKSNCACKSRLSGFYNYHALEISKDKIKLLNIKDENEITMLQEDVNAPTCYSRDNGYSNLIKVDSSSFKIKFKVNDNKIIPYADEGGEFTNGNLNLYKHNNGLCWLTDKRSFANINSCNAGIIVVDAGHGGKDPGAIGNNLVEKDINLDIALKLKTLLENIGWKVILTRDSDRFIELQDRAKRANDANADYFISIHADDAENCQSAEGSTIFYYNEKSKNFAEYFHKNIADAVGTKDRGVKRGEFLVIKETKMPSILIEVGFICNKNDASKIDENSERQKIAESVSNSVNLA